MNTKITNTIKKLLLFGTYGHIRSLEYHQGNVEFYFGGKIEEDKFQRDLLILELSESYFIRFAYQLRLRFLFIKSKREQCK